MDPTLCQQNLVERDDEEGECNDYVAITDIHPYLILSHLAGHRFEAVGVGDAPAPRADPHLLVSVGSAQVLLRRPGGDPNVSAVPAHEIASGFSVVCHKAGIVEPISWSLVRFFGREDEAMRDQFIDFALDTPEPALLPRLDVALAQTSQGADGPRAAWARHIRAHRIRPLLEAGLGSYLHP